MALWSKIKKNEIYDMESKNTSNMLKSSFDNLVTPQFKVWC